MPIFGWHNFFFNLEGGWPIFDFAGWGAFFHQRDPSIWANMLIIYPTIGICSNTDDSYCIPPVTTLPKEDTDYLTMILIRASLAKWLFKWHTVRIRTRLGIYIQIYPVPFRSSLKLRPRELLQAKGNILPYIPPLVLIQIQNIMKQYI